MSTETETLGEPDSLRQIPPSSPGAPGTGLEPARIAPRELVRLVDDFCDAKTLRKRITSLVGLVT